MWEPMRRVTKHICTLAPVLACTALVACSGPDFFGGDEAKKEPALSKVKAENGGAELPAEEDWSQVPVPAADNPKLAPIAMLTPVYAKPSRSATAIGYLRAGARVARSKEPVTKRDCKGGWFAVRPVGFVCADKDATIDLEHPIARAVRVEPDQKKPMPYAYAFLRSIAPNYLRVPSKEQMFQYEMRLARHLRSYKKLHER